MLCDLFSVTSDIEDKLGNGCRQANEDEAKAYADFLRRRRDLPDLGHCDLHTLSIGSGRRGGFIYRGATFGQVTANAASEAKPGGGWNYTPAQYENGAFSVIFPGHNLHRARVTLDTLDDAGEVIASQSLPVEPKKGGVIWSREDVRKAAGPVAKVAARKSAPSLPDPANFDRQNDFAAAIAGTESWFVAPRWSQRTRAKYAHRFSPAEYDALRAAWEACHPTPDAAEPAPTVEAMPPAPAITAEERLANSIAAGEALARAMIEAVEMAAPRPVERVEAVEAPQVHPEPVEALSEAESGQGAGIDPLAALLARVEALESRVAALPAEGVEARVDTPIADAARPKRTAAHERAIRRAWAERKAARGQRFIAQLRSDQLDNANRRAEYFRELAEGETVRANRAVQKRRRSVMALRDLSWKYRDMDRREGQIIAQVYDLERREADAYWKRRRAVLKARDLRAKLVAKREHIPPAVALAAVERERAKTADLQTALNIARKDLADAQEAIEAQERATRGAEGRAEMAQAELARLKRDMADPSQPERASDIARLIAERDQARTALAAVNARNASLQSAVDMLAPKFEAMVSRVTRAEAAMRAAGIEVAA